MKNDFVLRNVTIEVAVIDRKVPNDANNFQLSHFVLEILIIRFSLLFQDSLKTQVSSLPTKEDIKDLDICVKWPQFESALKHGSSESENSNTSASRANPGKNSKAPNPEILDTIKKIGDAADDHGKILDNIEELQVQTTVCKIM